MTVSPFFDEQVAVPGGFEAPGFRVRPLRVVDSPLDYEAVFESREMLRRIFGREWPRDDFTLEENTQDLVEHAREHLARTAFTFTVITLDESRVLGCVYVEPCPESGFDAQVRLWVRQSELDRGLDADLENAVRLWMSDAWRFKRVKYPGR